MAAMLCFNVLLGLLAIAHGSSWSQCPRGNCTADFNAIIVSCEDLGCKVVPPLDDETRKYLKTLELQNNAIRELPKLVYDSMDVLNVSYNQLRWIEDDTFLDCPMLQEVDLSHNNIQDVSKSAFAYASMEHIDLSFNQLSKVPEIQLQRLSLLNMSHNAIEAVLDYSFYEGGLEELNSLDMSYNRIDAIQGEAFNRMNYLRDLHLQGNRLTRLMDNVFHTYLYRLRYLDLSRNQIEVISHNAFSDLDNLEYLDLRNNKIQELRDVHFLGLYRLGALHLQNNQIQNLTEGLFSECDSLKILDVSSNPVAAIHPDVFVHKLGRPIPLETVHMNDLEYLTEIQNNTFYGLTELVAVELSHNVRLERIQSGAFDPKAQSIQSLNLRYNKLSTLDPSLLNWTQLVELDLAGNLWDCDCKLAWLKTPLFPPEFQQQVTCIYPTFLQGHTVNQIPVVRFSCAFLYENRREGAIALVLLVTMAFMVVGGVVLRKYRQTVFPCFYSTPVYRSFYNPLYTDEQDCEKAERAAKVTVMNEPTAL